MPKPSELTSYCGLYCGECIPRDERLFNAVRELKSAIDEVELDRYAFLRAQANGTMLDFPVFVRVLDEIEHIECKGPCAMGGGKKVCLIRDCVKAKGYRGCWECKDSKECNTLAPLKRFHGKTIEHNHKMIRQYGIDNWADKRGKHYPWK